MASRDTALACLVQMGVQNGLDLALVAARRGDVLDGDPCSSNAPICAVRAVI